MIDLSAAFASLGVGTAQFGNLYRATDEGTCRQTVDAAWAGGLRYFDTAPHYGLGLSERRLGAALQPYPRDSYVLSTKVGRLLRPNPAPRGSDLEDGGFDVDDELTRVYDYSAAGVRTSLSESLTRLGLDRVDIVWIHDPDSVDAVDEALTDAAPELERWQREGTIRAWGVGSNDARAVQRFVEESTPDLVMLAGRLTLLEQDSELAAACLRRGVGIVNVGVFNSGLLSAPHPDASAHYNYAAVPADVLGGAQAIAKICDRWRVSLPAAALAFSRRHPAVVNTTVGMRTPDHVASNLRLAATSIPDGLWRDLQAAGLLVDTVG